MSSAKKRACVVLFSFVSVCVYLCVFFGLWVEDSVKETSIIVDGSDSNQKVKEVGLN